MLARGQARLVKEQHYKVTLQSLCKNINESLPIPKKSEFLKLEEKFQALKELLLRDRFNSYQEKYCSFLKAFRALLQSPEYKQAILLEYDQRLQPCLKQIHELTYAFFAKIDLQDFSRQLIVEILGPIERQEFKEIRSLFLKLHKVLKTNLVSWKEKDFLYYLFYVKDQINFGFDPFFQGNVPFFFFSTHYRKQDQKRRVINMRLACPSIEDFTSIIFRQAAISPEFMGLLAAYRSMNKKHLYINLQERKAKLLWKNEAARCFALEQIMQDSPREFIFVGLAKNSPFYWQEEPFEHLNEAKAFKKKLFDELMKGDRFFWPSFLSQDECFCVDIEHLIDKIHESFFSSSDLLSKAERLDFIEIFYAYLIERLIDYTGVDSYNITCKDGIDRGVSMSALLYLLQVLRSDNPQIDIEDFVAFVFVPAMLGRLREIKDTRLERMLSAFTRLLNLKQQNISLELFDDGFSIAAISRTPVME